MAAASGIKRKRRPKNICPNPLFIKWLEEWRDEAIENGWKTSYTFNKAIRSLKQYPLPINSGTEAKILDNIGNKVAQLLDKKLSEYISNGGSMNDLHCINIESQPKEVHAPQSHTSPSQNSPSTSSCTGTEPSNNNNDTVATKKKRCKSLKEYVPAFRSGPYALLVALHKAEQDNEYYKGYMSKQELIEAAQPYCDTSFTVPNGPDSYYTAWSSMTTMIKKGLINKTSSPPKFSLTDDGMSLAMRLLLVQDDETLSMTANSQASITREQSSCALNQVSCSAVSISEEVPITISDSDDDDIIEVSPSVKKLKTCDHRTFSKDTSITTDTSTVTSNDDKSVSTTNDNVSKFSTNMAEMSSPIFQLKPGEFEVVLCIDNSESSANKKSKSQFRGLLLDELAKNGVKYSVRKLNIGDFLWIAKEIVDINIGQLRLPDSREIVLEYIIERKRMDDLADSIIDRRFNEQKFRMKQSSILYPVYLVEEHGGDMTHSKLPISSLHQAVTNTQVLDGFYIKQTKDIRESIAYLTIMTRHLKQYYSHKNIKAYSIDTLTSHGQLLRNSLQSNVCGIPFDTFNEASVKSKVSTASEMFARQLIQIPNSSAEKAHAIIEAYPTVSHLYDAYSNCVTEKEREEMISLLRAGSNSRKLGSALSKTVCSLYWNGK